MVEGTPLLAVENVRKTFHSGTRRTEVLRGVDLTISAGEFVAVTGASGSGKSTLLNLIAGLDRPCAGSIRLDGVDLADMPDEERANLRRQRIGTVFQDFRLLDMLTVEDNVAMPLVLRRFDRATARSHARALLELAGLHLHKDQLPHELSDGERRRVAIARALIVQPTILLADEPTSNLDSTNGSRIMELFRWLTAHQACTLILVTHNASEAERADRCIVLRDGRVRDQRAPRTAVDIQCRDPLTIPWKPAA